MAERYKNVQNHQYIRSCQSGFYIYKADDLPSKERRNQNRWNMYGIAFIIGMIIGAIIMIGTY